MVSKTVKTKVGQKITYKIIKDGFKTENGTIDVTSDMDTNVSIETPSTPYTSNIDYSIVENDRFPSIFKLNEDLTLPDDSILEKNEYLLHPRGEYFVEYDSGEKVYDNNFTVNGSVKNVGYIFSNFNTSNYLTLNGLFNPGSNVWETVIKINTTNLSSGGNCWLMGSNTSSNLSWLIGLLTASSPYSRVYLSSNGSSWDIASGVDGSHQYALYTDYWLKFEFTGSQYILSYSTDGQNFIQDIVINSTTPISNNQPIQIGNNEQHNAYFPGTVDLSETHIKIDGEIWWKPNVLNMTGWYSTVGSRGNKQDGIVKGFNPNNYLRLNPMPISTTTKSVDLIFKGMSQDLSSHNALIANISSEQYFGIRNTNKSFSVYNNGWVNGVNTLYPNIWYWFKVTLNGTKWTGYTLEDKNYTKETLPDISEWRQEWTTSSLVLTTNVFNLGFNPITTDEYWKGSLDLSQSSITLDGELWWDGTEYETIGFWNDENEFGGFTSSNYLTTSSYMPICNNWEVGLKIKTADIARAEGQSIFSIGDISSEYCFMNLAFATNGTNMYLKTGNDSNTNILNKSLVSPAKDATYYYIKVVIEENKSAVYFSTTGFENMTLKQEVESGTPITNNVPIKIGYDPRLGKGPFSGSFGLDECYIKIDNKLWWKGILKNKFRKGNFKEIGSPSLDMNGVVSNFSDYNYIQFPYVVNNETEIFTKFTTGSDISNMPNLITIFNSSNQGGGEIYIYNNEFQTWNMAISTNVTLVSALPNTSYQARMKLNPSGRTITIYDAEGNVITEHTENDSGATFTNTSVINFGFLNSNQTSRFWKGSIDLANTYVIVDGVKYNLLENDGVYLQGIFDESFVDNYTEEQSVKLYNTVSSDTNTLTITEDNVTDGLYSQYIDNITIPSRSKQFTYNIDDEVWEEI